MSLLLRTVAVILVGGIILTALPVVLLRLVGGGFYITPSGSMQPGFPVNSAFLSWPIGEGEIPARGTVVVFDHPTRPGVDYVKRLIALPGDRVAMIDGRLVLNGERVSLEPAGPVETWLTGVGYEAPDCPPNHMGRHCTVPSFTETLPGTAGYQVLDLAETAGDSYAEVTVPADHVFVLGDYRDNSLDSRFPGVGFVPAASLKSSAWRYYLSWKDPVGSVSRLMQRVGP